MSIEQKTAIVTGGANGIGKAIARAFAKQGANVVIIDRDIQNGEAFAAQLQSDGFEAIFVAADVRKVDDIERFVQEAAGRFGRIDYLINNAGVSRWKSPYELTVEEWDDVLSTNLRSAFFASREAAKYMRRNAKGGAIVNIASTRALMSEPNSEAYAASKGGLVALTHALAVSFADDRIRVNCISPGWIETGDYGQLRDIDHRQHPAGRVGKPDDIARACLYLCDEENDFITGVNLVIDGGMTRKMIYIE
ncbi:MULTISPECIES: SDR family NAD(P)-dependent oxidoreductase [Geobacillus]|uniref:SDR family NAD(P)-dependent oxidoreductase n=4 Tax=Geobacillus TaxID=129337 RepID=A0A2Z3N3A2_GEOTH|nr:MULTISPECIES: glucose 1-dehydrogenase [Geobacillus]AEV18485.1 Short-chain dehydrogenase/reductase [Geobacillus thermoleovorans CCB_US3_UF5]AWO73500.1 SDR family NAD(P)-dependent oxidoreductase [Geobacillus thermoleovorans]MBW7643058.1 glucose 1-dehydrogenase [Geobacillus thermoleovorans]OQP15107.1 3-ketoacyl-ACP reductase [Geobacillus thermoleovorans]QDY72695.1 glucose 1-dehydrogenase [Geobacillus thermoleovorans]